MQLPFTHATAWLALLLVTLLTGCQSPAGREEPSSLLGSASEIRSALLDQYQEWRGVPYRSGGQSRRGVDCSGFVSIVYREVYGKQLARSSADMLKYNCKKVSRAKLQEGDLVFFKTGRGGKRGVPNHVGIYLKNGRFIHTSTSSGVMVSSLSEPYYTRTWLTGGRVK